MNGIGKPVLFHLVRVYFYMKAVRQATAVLDWYRRRADEVQGTRFEDLALLSLRTASP